MDRLPEPNREAAERVLAQQLAAEQSKRSQPTARRALDSARVNLGERRAVCPQHGEYESSGVRLGVVAREIWSGCPACASAKVDAERAEAAEQARQRRAAQIEEAMGAAAIPKRFLDRSFDNFSADSASKAAALAVSREYVDSFPSNLARGLGLIFLGLPGTGKSHLAASIMRPLVEQGYACQYTTCMGVIRAVRETWRRESSTSEKGVLAQLGSGIDLLVIDEVGVQYGTEAEQHILFDVMDRRYREMRPTILLSNQDKAGFRACVGDRIYDRLTETSRLVIFDWPSHRAAARGARQ